jgi:hypothetical protein
MTTPHRLGPQHHQPRLLRAIREHDTLFLTDPSSGRTLVRCLIDNPLTEPSVTERWIRGVPGDELPALWTGWTGDTDRGASDLEAGVFERSITTWTGPGRQRLDAALPALLDAAASGTSHPLAPPRRLLLRAHARHVISDPQSVLTAFRGGKNLAGWCPDSMHPADAPTGYLFEPAAFLTPEMLGESEDHLARSFEALPIQPWCWGTLLTGLLPTDTAWGEPELQPVPITEGVLHPDTLARLWAASGARHLPVALLDHDFDEQARLLTHAWAAAPDPEPSRA